eukprot:gene38451-46732_t
MRAEIALLVLSFVLKCSALSDGFGYNYFSRTNTKNVTLPTSRSDAELKGWVRAVRKDGQDCRAGLGIEYTEGGDSHSRNRPLSLFFEASKLGRLSALSVRAWFTDTSFYNPNTWQLPSFGVLEDGERWITVTTRDPAAVCDEHVDATASRGLLGDRLVVNANSSPAGSALLHIPTLVPTERDGAWKFGACQADMSRHWGYPLDGDAASLYGRDHGVHVLPIIPMYSVPDEANGGITALAFFTTEPQVTFKNGGVWDASGTPAQLCSGNFCLDETRCEYGESNSVFHVFFVDQWTAPAQCGAAASPGCSAPY